METKHYVDNYGLLQSSQDIDGGTSMARHLTKVADSGAQDSNKFPSNNNNHNDSFKLTNKDTMNETDVKEKTVEEIEEDNEAMKSETPTATPSDENIPMNEYAIADNYKRTWGIPLVCKLVGGGESTLNSNNAGPISNSTANNSPSSGAGGTNNGGGNNWPAGPNQTATGAGGNNAWNTGGNGNNSGGRQPVVSNNPSSNNASHPSNTSQNSSKRLKLLTFVVFIWNRWW